MNPNRSFTRRQFSNGGQPSEFMQCAAKAVQEALPKDHGFCLLAFPLDSRDGGLRYVSNGSRESVLKLLKEFVAKQEAKDAFDAPTVPIQDCSIEHGFPFIPAKFYESEVPHKCKNCGRSEKEHFYFPDDSGKSFFCTTHSRLATFIKQTTMRGFPEDQHCCDPDLGGITMACKCDQEAKPEPPKLEGN